MKSYLYIFERDLIPKTIAEWLNNISHIWMYILYVNILVNKRRIMSEKCYNLDLVYIYFLLIFSNNL